MSTKCTVGLSGNVHIYTESFGDGLFVQTDTPSQQIKICEASEWDDILKQIIRHFLQCVYVDSIHKTSMPSNLWDSRPFDKQKLINNLATMIEAME